MATRPWPPARERCTRLMPLASVEPGGAERVAGRPSSSWTSSSAAGVSPAVRWRRSPYIRNLTPSGWNASTARITWSHSSPAAASAAPSCRRSRSVRRRSSAVDRWSDAMAASCYTEPLQSRLIGCAHLPAGRPVHMKMAETYTARDITVLDGLEPVRKRPGHVHRRRRVGRPAPPRVGDPRQRGGRGDERPRPERAGDAARRPVVHHNRRRRPRGAGGPPSQERHERPCR